MKKIIAIVLMITLGMVPLYVNAEKKEMEPITLTKSEAIDKLKENSTTLRKLDVNLNTMNRSYNDLLTLRNTMDNLKRAYESFAPLYEKEQTMIKSTVYIKHQKFLDCKKKLENLDPESGTYELDKENLEKEIMDNTLSEEEIRELATISLTPEEIGTLLMLKTQFGPVPRQLTPKEEFEMFIKNKEFPYYAMEGAIENFKRTQKTVSNSLELGVIELYNGILQMKEGKNLQESFYEKALKDYKIVDKKYELGLISELERKSTEVELNKTKFQLEQFKRQIENMEMQFKALIGVEINREVKISQDKEELKFKEIPLSYDGYLNKALVNRAEIKNALKELDVKQREFNIIKDYFKENDFQWKEANASVIEKVLLIDDARKKIELDIQKGYLNLTQKRDEIEVAKKKLEQINIQYENIVNTYEAGLTTIDMKWNVELGKIKSEMDYKSALINYNNALRKIEMASNLGPAYEGQGR